MSAIPQCIHFGACGGCQWQDVAYAAQLARKRDRVLGLMDAGVVPMPRRSLTVHHADPYAYRNRIRLRVEREAEELRFGYNRRGTTEFLPIGMCPIAADVLWHAAQAMLDAAAENADAALWLGAAREVEFFADDTFGSLQITLLCPPRTSLPQGSFVRMMHAVSARAPEIVGAGAIAVDAKTGPTGRVFDAWGKPGMLYRVGDEAYWISRGGFFQVNRFLIATLVELVTGGRAGTIAWDLFAGVGLFWRVLARSFAQVTAVEAAPSAAKDLAVALRAHGEQHRAVANSVLAFLEQAVVERERPELIVLDPPRAGAGEAACRMLAKLAAPTIVYVSCDPETLARDAAVLCANGYSVERLDLVDLFPQTTHVESVMVFARSL